MHRSVHPVQQQQHPHDQMAVHPQCIAVQMAVYDGLVGQSNLKPTQVLLAMSITAVLIADQVQRHCH